MKCWSSFSSVRAWRAMDYVILSFLWEAQVPDTIELDFRMTFREAFSRKTLAKYDLFESTARFNILFQLPAGYALPVLNAEQMHLLDYGQLGVPWPEFRRPKATGSLSSCHTLLQQWPQNLSLHKVRRSSRSKFSKSCISMAWVA
jgi:hypothetical protein